MDQANLNENVDLLFHSLENFTQNEGVIGKPVIQGDKTFLPIISVTVGYGGGNGKMSKNQQSAGMGAGMGNTGALGLGARLSTDAIILINNQDVTLLPVGSNASMLADKIPQIISSMNQNKQQGQAQNPSLPQS